MVVYRRTSNLYCVLKTALMSFLNSLFNPIKAGIFFAFYVRGGGGGGRFDPTLWQLITFKPLTIAILYLLR